MWRRIPKIRFRMRALLALVALAALGMGLAREYWKPARVWRRAVRSTDPKLKREGWNQVWRGRIDGLTPDQTRAEVIAATGDGKPEVRVWALMHVRRMDEVPFDRFSLYLRLLDDPSTPVRNSAAEAVGDSVRMTKTGRDRAEPALVAMLDEPDPWTRKCVLEALGDLVRSGEAGSKDPLLDVVAAKIVDPDETVWLTAAHVLSRSGRGEEAVPKLETQMIADRARNGGKAPAGTGTADNALARIADRSDRILAFFLREVYRKGQGVPNRFLFALQWVSGPAQDRAEGQALQALRSDDRDLRVGAAYYLESVGRAPATRATWLEALHHSDPEVRSHALNSLRLIAGKDRTVRDAMRSVRDTDEDPAVRKAAADALYVSPGFPDPDAAP